MYDVGPAMRGRRDANGDCLDSFAISEGKEGEARWKGEKRDFVREGGRGRVELAGGTEGN